jgi:Flp pilus assembly protein TadG
MPLLHMGSSMQRIATRQHTRHRRGRRQGQALVELALVLPILLVLFGSALDLGRLYYSQITINNAAKEGALEAARDTENLGEFDSTQDCDSETNRVICLIINEAKGSLISIVPGDVALTCDVAAVAGSPNPCPTDATIGDTVTIEVTADFFLVSPILSVFFGGQTIPIAASSVAQIGVDPHPGYVLTPTPSPTPAPTPTPTPDPLATPTPTPDPLATPTPTPTPAACLAPVVGGPIDISPTTGKSAAHPSGGTTFTMAAPTVNAQPGCTFTYTWSFGDALSGTGAEVTHLYGFAGSGPGHQFTVTLVIATGSGPSTTLTRTVSVTS